MPPAEPALKLHDDDLAPETPKTLAARQLTAGIVPELLTAAEAAAFCGRSRSSWWRDHAAGRVPDPVRIGRATRWSRSELLAWIAAACPPRERWQALKATRPR